MKRISWTLLTLLPLAAITVGILLTPASSLAQSTTKSTAKPKPTVEMYDVVQVGDEIKVVAVKALKDEQKRAKTENDKAMKEWKRAKKSDPRPRSRRR